ncbi:cell division protein ZapA [Rheinheimera sp. WS51]|uniref:cell division protein ZapA n=1 Tax=Rheinheimera sp. WS51 TaxID=3425886 RepID=UPI003D9390DB
MSSKQSVQVNVLNRYYNIKVPQGATSLLESLAVKLDEQLNQLAKQAPQFGRDELLVLVALNALQREDQLLEQQKSEQQQLQQLVGILQQQINNRQPK